VENITNIYLKFFHCHSVSNSVHKVSKANCFCLQVNSPEGESILVLKSLVVYFIHSDDGKFLSK